MAAELVDRLATFVAVRHFRGMGAGDSRSLHYYIYVRMHHFVRQTTYVPYRRFGGMFGESSCNVFFLLFMAL